MDLLWILGPGMPNGIEMNLQTLFVLKQKLFIQFIGKIHRRKRWRQRTENPNPNRQ